jgi:hypothetical protein
MVDRSWNFSAMREKALKIWEKAMAAWVTMPI